MKGVYNIQLKNHRFQKKKKKSHSQMEGGELNRVCLLVEDDMCINAMPTGLIKEIT